MRRVISCLILLTFITLNFSPLAMASTEVWQQPVKDKILWGRTTVYGTLLIGAKGSLSSYNPETGEVMWTREDFSNLAPYEVREVSGYPILIVVQSTGIAGSKSIIEAIDMGSGQTKWKTDKMFGAPLGIYTVPDKTMTIFVSNVYTDKNKDPGIYLLAFDAVTGEQKWESPFPVNPKKIPLYVADNSGMFSVTLDLGGYQDPVFDGNNAYFSIAGLHCVDVTTGNILWGVEFPTADKTYKKSYAAPIIEGDVVYATGNGEVYAVDKNTGEVKWKSEKVRSGLISQLIVADEMVLAKIGGNFFSPGAKDFLLDKPLAVKSYNKTDGSALWEYTGASGGLTNLVYLPALHTVMLADAKSLIGIDSQSKGKVKEAFKTPLEFKRSIGTTDVASAGVKALTGGLGGLLKAGAKMAVGKEREDPPVSISGQDNGAVVIRGRQHILSFAPDTKEINWSLYYPSPGPSTLGTALMVGVSAFAALGYQMQYATGQSSMSGASQNITSTFARMDRYMDKRYSKSQSGQEHAFILTKVTGEEGSGIGILAINLATGNTDGEFIFNEKEPEYTVDHPGGRVYFFKGKKTIVAYDIK